MSDLNPILSGSAQSIAAYQEAIEQSTQAVVQWLKQPENLLLRAWATRPPLSAPLNISSKTASLCIIRSAWRICTAQAW